MPNGFSFDLSDIADLIGSSEVSDFAQEQAEDTITAIFVDLTAPPPTGTPVDTGAARNSWQIDMSVPLAPEVYTTSVYMNRLNLGWSQQSPAMFIEAAIDRHTD